MGLCLGQEHHRPKRNGDTKEIVEALMPDQDGYPTDDELKRIDNWPEHSKDDPDRTSTHRLWNELFDFVKSIWWMAEWGWDELSEPPEHLRDCHVEAEKYRWLAVSTGGWSGNEEIISHLQNKFIVWGQTWLNHRRGGHYVFAVRRPE